MDVLNARSAAATEPVQEPTPSALANTSPAGVEAIPSTVAALAGDGGSARALGPALLANGVAGPGGVIGTLLGDRLRIELGPIGATMAFSVVTALARLAEAGKSLPSAGEQLLGIRS